MKSEKPFVSVIIPSYNHANFLQERIQSILNQTYTNFEVIILDDKSTDNSIKIIREFYKDPHISNIIVNEKNSGSPFIQWYKGISLAKGDIIWIAECDDSCELDMLEQLISIYTKYDCVYAFSRSMVIDSEGNQQYISQRHFNKDVHMIGLPFIKKYLCVSNTVRNASSVIFSKKAALAISKEFMDYHECGDWIFWIEMAKFGNVAVISKPLNHFRRYSTTNTSVASKSGLADMEDKRVFDFLKASKLINYSNSFIKQKRMANKLMTSDVYANDEIRCEVRNFWDLSYIYFVISFFSVIFHKLFK